MPQDGSNNYFYPPGTPGIPDTTIESEAYNTFLDDLVVNDLNIPRPVHRGGTGASTADAALVNLKAEKAEQVVTAYLSQLWLPGSFRSAASATDAPVAGHEFAGICYINEPLVSPPTNANVTVEARDMTDGKLYVRRKVAGVWDVAGWKIDGDDAFVNVAGDTMTGDLTISKATPSIYLDKAASGQDSFFFGKKGGLFRWGLNFGDATAESGSNVGSNFALLRFDDAGTLIGATLSADRSTGLMQVKADPTAVLGIATKQYVDAVRDYAAPNANILINGDFRVNQSGYVSSAVLAAGAYGHDQWKAGASGGDYSFTQLKSSTQITIAAGKSLIQPIEDANVSGGSYVLSWTGTTQARAGVNTLTPSGAYAASPLLISGQTAGTVMSVEFNTGTLGTVKLEKGSTVSSFVMRPYELELTACQRYWQLNFISWLGQAQAGNNYYGAMSLLGPMRTTPSIIGTNANANGFAASAGSLSVVNNAAIQEIRTAEATGLCWFFTNLTLSARL